MRNIAIMALLLAVAPREKAACPVDKKQFDVKADTPRSAVNGKPLCFCNRDCLKSFAKEPEKYVDATTLCPIMKKKTVKLDSKHRFAVNNALWYVCCNDCVRDFPKNPFKVTGDLIDPVTKKSFKPAANSPKSESKGQTFYFSAPASKTAFDKEPEKYAIDFGS